MGSEAIANALEKAYPDHPLHLDAPQLARAEELRGQAIGAVIGVPGRRFSATLLNERSIEYIEATVDLSGLPDGDEAWDGARPVLEAMGALLKEKGGPFVLGETGRSPVLSCWILEKKNKLRTGCIWLIQFFCFSLVRRLHPGVYDTLFQASWGGLV